MCFELDSLPPIPVDRAAPRSPTRISCSRRPTATASRRSARRPSSRPRRASSCCRTSAASTASTRSSRCASPSAATRAVAIDYFGRTAGVDKRGDDFPYLEHVAQTTQAGIQADVRAAVDAAARRGRRGDLHGRLLLRRPQLVARGGGGPRPRRRGRLLRPAGRAQRAARADAASRARCGADPGAPGRRRREHHAGAERRVRRRALSRGRRARGRRLRRRAAQLLRPALRGARRGVGGRLAARARVHRATRWQLAPASAKALRCDRIENDQRAAGLDRLILVRRTCACSVSLSIVAASARSSASAAAASPAAASSRAAA